MSLLLVLHPHLVVGGCHQNSPGRPNSTYSPASQDSKGNLAYFSFRPGLFSLKATIFFCSGTLTFMPPCSIRWTLASFSGSPAVQMRPGPFGALRLSRNAFRNSPEFFLNVSRGHSFSMSMAKKKCPGRQRKR